MGQALDDRNTVWSSNLSAGGEGSGDSTDRRLICQWGRLTVSACFVAR